MKEHELSGNEFDRLSIDELKSKFSGLKEGMMDLLGRLSESTSEKLNSLAQTKDGSLDIGGAVDKLLKTREISAEERSILENYTKLGEQARGYTEEIKRREKPDRESAVARAQADTEARQGKEIARGREEIKFDRLRSILREVDLVDDPTLIGIPSEEQIRGAISQYITEAKKILRDAIFVIAQGVGVEEFTTNARGMVQLDDPVIRRQVQKYDPEGFRDIDELWQQIPK